MYAICIKDSETYEGETYSLTVTCQLVCQSMNRVRFVLCKCPGRSDYSSVKSAKQNCQVTDFILEFWAIFQLKNYRLPII